MSRLTDRLEQHPLHERVRDLRGQLAELDDDDREAAEEEHEGTLARVETVLTYVTGVVAAADPELTTEADLAAIDSGLNQCVSAASQIAASPANTASLDTALELVLAATANLVVASPILAERAGASAEAFDNGLRSTVEEVRERAVSLAEELAQTKAELDTARTEAQTAVTEREQAATNEANALTARIDQETIRVDALITDHEARFTTAEEERSSAYTEASKQEQAERDKRVAALIEEKDEALTELRTASEKTLTELRTSSETAINELRQSSETTLNEQRDQGQDLLGEVKRYRDEVKALRGIVADDTTTSEFGADAKDQKTQADVWRAIAVVAGLLAAAVAVLADRIIGLDAADHSTSAALTRAGATFAVLAVAGYAARQSGIHRRREDTSKRLQLELVAFSPFIEALDEQQQRDMRQAFAQRAFRGRPADEPSKGSDSIGTMQEAEQFVEGAVKRVLARRDKTGDQGQGPAPEA